VIKINGNEYRLALLDTNAVSEFVKHRASLRSFFTWMHGPPMYVPCFSIFSILELGRRDDVYKQFKDLFQVVPCLIIKSHEQLLEEEVRSYPDPSNLDPVLLAFSALGGEGMDLDRVLGTAFGDDWLLDRARYWNESAHGIVEGIASLVSNYPPEGETYRPAEARHFVEVTTFEQLAMRQADFAKYWVKERSEVVDIRAFPSVKATSYAVWHKFYSDRNRKIHTSDAFDIIIASAVPYVDAVVTESHLAESLRKTQRMDDFIEHITIYTLRDFR
jgi:hypothetical protein